MNYDDVIHEIKEVCVNLNDKIVGQQERIEELEKVIESREKGLITVYYGMIE